MDTPVIVELQPPSYRGNQEVQQIHLPRNQEEQQMHLIRNVQVEIVAGKSEHCMFFKENVNW